MASNLEQIYDMLDKAFARFDCLDGLIMHSDQGWQYQHYGYRKRLEENTVLYKALSRKATVLTTQWSRTSSHHEIRTSLC